LLESVENRSMQVLAEILNADKDRSRFWKKFKLMSNKKQLAEARQQRHPI